MLQRWEQRRCRLLLSCPAAPGRAASYEVLADAVRVALASAIDAPHDAEPLWESRAQKIEWLTQMSDRLPRRAMPGFEARQAFLLTVRYEAQRAGLDPEMVLGNGDADALFRMRVNIRYGCVILRHYQ